VIKLPVANKAQKPASRHAVNVKRCPLFLGSSPFPSPKWIGVRITEMRSKPIKAVDPDKFLRAYQAVVKGSDKPLPEGDGIDIVDEDGSVQSLKINDHPMTRAVYALSLAFPNDDTDEHSAMMMRLHALFQITRHPAVQEFVQGGDAAIEINGNLIRGAAICPLQKNFLPNQLLQAIRSLSEPTPIWGG
jgi:hypothetical protein